MEIKTHRNSRTTIAIRKEIRNSNESIYALSQKFNLSWNTVKRWKDSESLEDKSSRPHTLRTTLTKEQEDRICFERKQFKKTVEDIFFTLENEISDIYPMKIYRCLKRHELSVLPSEFIEAERKIRKFRRYGIGYLHIDLLYAPKINKKRAYVYTAIDRVGKAAFIMFGKRKDKYTGARFLKKVVTFYPYKINYILTDNGFEFSYKALPKRRNGKKIKATKKIHPFDKICEEKKIQHRTIKFKHPWTNGMVERFNRKIKDGVLKRHLFESIFEMEEKTIEFVNQYNQTKRLKQLSYRTPAQYLKEHKDLTIPFIQRIVI